MKRIIAPAATLLAALTAQAWAATPATQLANVNGNVLVETGSGAYAPYQSGTALHEGDRVLITQDASATLQAEGCAVELAPNSIHTIAAQPCATVNAAAAAPAGPSGGAPAAGGGSGWLTAAGLLGAAVVVGVAYDSSDDKRDPPNISPQ